MKTKKKLTYRITELEAMNSKLQRELTKALEAIAEARLALKEEGK